MKDTTGFETLNNQELAFFQEAKLPEWLLPFWSYCFTVKNRVNSIIVGESQDKVMRLALVCLFGSCEGDVFLNPPCGPLKIKGPPASGKSAIAKAMAYYMGGTFRSLTLDVDTEPGKLSGGMQYVGGRLVFVPGILLLGNIIVLDEVNRAQTTTLNAALEPLGEGCVSTIEFDELGNVISDRRREVRQPFFVILIENPFEIVQASFPESFAFRDRVAASIRTRHLNYEEKKEYAKRSLTIFDNAREERGEPVSAPEQVMELRRCIRAIPLSMAVQDYVSALSASVGFKEYPGGTVKPEYWGGENVQIFSHIFGDDRLQKKLEETLVSGDTIVHTTGERTTEALERLGQAEAALRLRWVLRAAADGSTRAQDTLKRGLRVGVEDIKRIAQYVLQHRITFTHTGREFASEYKGGNEEQFAEEIARRIIFLCPIPQGEE